VDRATSVSEKSPFAVRKLALDLGDDRHGNLVCGFRADIQSYRRMNSFEVGVRQYDALFEVLGLHLVESLAWTEDSDKGCFRT
jgi:hypothetical protein